jgi:hypothetical protein
MSGSWGRGCVRSLHLPGGLFEEGVIGGVGLVEEGTQLPVQFRISLASLFEETIPLITLQRER